MRNLNSDSQTLHGRINEFGGQVQVIKLNNVELRVFPVEYTSHSNDVTTVLPSYSVVDILDLSFKPTATSA